MGVGGIQEEEWGMMEGRGQEEEWRVGVGRLRKRRSGEWGEGSGRGVGHEGPGSCSLQVLRPPSSFPEAYGFCAYPGHVRGPRCGIAQAFCFQKRNQLWELGPREGWST